MKSDMAVWENVQKFGMDFQLSNLPSNPDRGVVAGSRGLAGLLLLKLYTAVGVLGRNAINKCAL